MSIQLSELQSAHDLDKIVSANGLERLSSSDRERLRVDFERGYFGGLLASDEQSGALLSYVLYYNSYSSWQNRVLYIAEIWFASSDSAHNDADADNKRHSLLRRIKQRLCAYCRQHDYQRINVNVREIARNEPLIRSLLSDDLGAVNLGRQEDWLIFEMGHAEMRSFAAAASTAAVDTAQYEIVKVADMRQYCEPIRELIREISVFERMEEQFRTSASAMVRDYEPDVVVGQQATAANRFYEAMVVLKHDPADASRANSVVVGYSLYYMNYDVEKGRGCYLEDLYIQEAYRRGGLGTALWRRVVDDCLTGFGATYMQWTVLAWNTPAIELYFKYKSIDLTRLYNLSLFRITTDNIYADTTAAD